MYETAVEHGAVIRKKCKVTSIRPHNIQPSVVLESGETIETDVIIGADGVAGLSRAVVIGDNENWTDLYQVMYK